jgi:hypothetical protein
MDVRRLNIDVTANGVDRHRIRFGTNGDGVDYSVRGLITDSSPLFTT